MCIYLIFTILLCNRFWFPKFTTGCYNINMNTLIFIFIFLLGTIIGSFLNVVIYRFNTGKSIAKGRSICMSCNKNLRWYELIPIFSFLIQFGKCRRCTSPISRQYPLVEFITGLVFVLLVNHFMPLLSLSYPYFIHSLILFSFLFSLLIIISFYDIRHKIIPDKLVYLFIAVSFLSIFVVYSNGGLSFSLPPLLTILSGLIFAAPFAFLWLISKGKWMGLGDAKLILGIGWMLGPTLTPSALILAFWIGAIVSLIVIFLSDRLLNTKKIKIGMKTEIPFAPFLIIGTLIAFLFELDIVSLLSLFHS